MIFDIYSVWMIYDKESDKRWLSFKVGSVYEEGRWKTRRKKATWRTYFLNFLTKDDLLWIFYKGVLLKSVVFSKFPDKKWKQKG